MPFHSSLKDDPAVDWVSAVPDREAPAGGDTVHAGSRSAPGCPWWPCGVAAVVAVRVVPFH